MLSLTDLIKTRRTIGAFTGQPVPTETINTLLDTAIWAPNHRLTEPWRFIILQGEGTKRYASIRREMLLDMMPGSSEEDRKKAGDGTYAKFISIPTYLFVLQKVAADAEIAEEDYATCSALIQNFLLLAWEQGIASAWKTFKDDPRLRAFMGIQSNEKVVGAIHLGYAAEAPTSRRTPAVERVTVIEQG